jgi:serine/threonine-protein kinase
MNDEKLKERYKITERLGEGGMGEVYKALDERTDQQVAVKFLARQWLANPEVLERFHREAETLRQLDHPNIVKFIDAFEHEGQYVIVMEYLPGGSLLGLLKQGALPVERAQQIALDLCDALIRAHRLNIIHRDIKPENVLIDSNGTPKLADFGVARLTEFTRMTRSGTQVGTPYYMSPEAWEGKNLDAQADIWSLGVMLFEMLAGRVPFDGETGPAVMTKVFTAPPPDLRKLRADVPSGLAVIVNQMLARDKNKRYQTVRQVAVDLESGQRMTTPVPSKSAPVAFPEFFKSLFNVRALLITGVLIIGGLIGFDVISLPKITLPDTTEQSIVGESSPAEETPEIGSTRVSAKDGMTLVYVPAGNFVMGRGNGQEDEKPVHTVFLDAYWIDQTEVTNGMYQQCVSDDICEPPSLSRSFTREGYFGNPEYDNFPVIYVNWDQAVAYCAWADRRLPTEAEWEKAARGTAGSLYPWGNESPSLNLAIFNNFTGDTAEVAGYPDGASVYSVMDMAGNVFEWVYDWYDESYYSDSPEINPQGPNLLSGSYRVIRGGAWNSLGHFLQSGSRNKLQPSLANYYVGFRCAISESP